MPCFNPVHFYRCYFSILILFVFFSFVSICIFIIIVIFILIGFKAHLDPMSPIEHFFSLNQVQICLRGTGLTLYRPACWPSLSCAPTLHRPGRTASLRTSLHARPVYMALVRCPTAAPHSSTSQSCAPTHAYSTPATTLHLSSP